MYADIIIAERLVSRSLPEFAHGQGIDAVADFRAFVAAMDRPAVHLLAELAEIHHFGDVSDIPAVDDTVARGTGLLCRHVGAWRVFYTYGTSPFRITILLAGDVGDQSQDALEDEATERLRQL